MYRLHELSLSHFALHPPITLHFETFPDLQDFGQIFSSKFWALTIKFWTPPGWIGHVKECGEETARFLSSSLLMAFNGCFLSEEEKERAIWNYLFSQESNLELLISHFPNRVNRAAREKAAHGEERERHKDPTFPPKLKLVLGPHSCPARWYVATFYCRPPWWSLRRRAELSGVTWLVFVGGLATLLSFYTLPISLAIMLIGRFRDIQNIC